MPRSENQKIKLLRLYDILRMYSDAEHPLSTNDLIEKLKELGIPCERKALADDIRILNEYGYEIGIKRSQHNLYYVRERDLEPHAIRFLIDATQSAAFLTAAQTKQIVGSVSTLASSYKSDVLECNVLCFDKLKHSNENVFSIISDLDLAIERKKVVTFEYHVLQVSGKAEPNRDQNGNIKRYEAHPVALAYHAGYYYFIAYSTRQKGIASYRVDRMMHVCIEKKDAEVPKEYEEKIKNGEMKNSMSAFGMWVGETRPVTMRLLNRHAGDILDKFGEKTRLYPDGDEHFQVTVEVNPDDLVFVGWCLSYGNELEILAPRSLQEKLLGLAKDVVSMYGRNG